MNINRVCFAGNLTAEPEVNYSPKGTEVVSASIFNNEFYGCAYYGVGRMEG
jgi:single-stranded DNA-binding protein